MGRRQTEKYGRSNNLDIVVTVLLQAVPQIAVREGAAGSLRTLAPRLHFREPEVCMRNAVIGNQARKVS